MTMRIRGFNIVQWALVSGLLYAILGLIIGLIWTPFVALMSIMGAGMMHSGVMGSGLGFFAIVLFPIMYFIIGFIFGLIFAALYNLVARWTGGVEMTLDTVPTAGAVGAPLQV